MSCSKIVGRATIVAVFGFIGIASNVRAVTFSDIQDWIGTGSNEAGFEIDWYDGTTDYALCWGYRWNGTATGEQMLDAIVPSDPRLFAEVSGTTQYGTALFGLGYDQDGDQPFALSPSFSFNSQHLAFTGYDLGPINCPRHRPQALCEVLREELLD